MIATADKNFPETEMILAAIQFINCTGNNIFLTGKAGTGKTTFLRNLASRTHKQMAIVAPTGIAALNAGGVTIHSQFLLPLGMFIPDSSFQGSNSEEYYYNSSILARKHPLNSIRKQVLRSIDLLVIDEVSMLRADLLDAIDYRLKAAKGNFNTAFGGVQLLMIGDLYQLPPVVKREEENTIRSYYSSPWFFESKALKKDGFIYIELDKIFRQKDDLFINILNNLRNNRTTKEDIQVLNKYYKPSDEIRTVKEVITLTTHNYRADELNSRALHDLSSPSFILEATIEGEFPENMFPVLKRLELKEGAQIMFTKNDADQKSYFNGKLATIASINPERVEVLMADTHESYVLKKELWENKRYSIDPVSKEMRDDVMGTFSQYPVKLAWAITVHKSQGLTFDNAIIDVAQAFAEGQVYVALSRLRSMDGLILSAYIDPQVVRTNNEIVSFSEKNNHPAELVTAMKQGQQNFLRQVIIQAFDFNAICREIEYIIKNKAIKDNTDEETMKPALVQIRDLITKESNNTTRFREQLLSLLESGQQDPFMQRINKGREYYKDWAFKIVKMLLIHLKEIQMVKGAKTYFNSLVELDQLWVKKLEEMDKTFFLAEMIFLNREDIDFVKLRKDRASARLRLMDELGSYLTVQPRSRGKRVKGKKSKKSGGSTFDINATEK